MALFFILKNKSTRKNYEFFENQDGLLNIHKVKFEKTPIMLERKNNEHVCCVCGAVDFMI